MIMIDNPLPDQVMEEYDNEYLSEQFYEHCRDKANKLAEYKAQVEHQIEEAMKDIEKLPIGEKIKLFSEITKLKKELRKL